MPTVTIQPSTADGYVSQNSPTIVQDNGIGTEGWAGRPSTSTNYYLRTFLKFDISSLPSDAVVSSATFQVYVRAMSTAGGAFTTTVAKVNASWAETTLTWNNQPTASNDEGTRTSGATTVNAFNSWTITNIVQAWISGTYSNHGLRLKTDEAASGQSYINFWSREHTTASERPKLVVTYSSPPIAPTSLAPAGTSYPLSQTVAFSWTHNDPDSDAQSAYEIRWRRSGSSDAYSTLTATTSTQSRNEPASTFNVGTWEYNVRTKDTGTSTFGAWSSTQTFMVTGIERWGVIHI